jgi:hypothetical protein
LSLQIIGSVYWLAKQIYLTFALFLYDNTTSNLNYITKQLSKLVYVIFMFGIAIRKMDFARDYNTFHQIENPIICAIFLKSVLFCEGH